MSTYCKNTKFIIVLCIINKCKNCYTVHVCIQYTGVYIIATGWHWLKLYRSKHTLCYECFIGFKVQRHSNHTKTQEPQEAKYLCKCLHAPVKLTSHLSKGVVQVKCRFSQQLSLFQHSHVQSPTRTWNTSLNKNDPVRTRADTKAIITL